MLKNRDFACDTNALANVSLRAPNANRDPNTARLYSVQRRADKTRRRARLRRGELARRLFSSRGVIENIQEQACVEEEEE